MDEVRLLVLKQRRLLRSRGRSIDDTEDLIQEAFLRLQVYCRDKDVAQTEAFLVRTALNLSIDQHRRETVAAPVPGALDAIVERAVDKGVAALCAEAVGIIEALNEATLNYLKTRKQFGVPIGSFQALQHRMADMFIAAEQSRSMAVNAAVYADSEDAAARRRAVSGAKAYIGRAARLVGQEAVQMHEAVGWSTMSSSVIISSG